MSNIKFLLVFVVVGIFLPKETIKIDDLNGYVVVELDGLAQEINNINSIYFVPSSSIGVKFSLLNYILPENLNFKLSKKLKLEYVKGQTSESNNVYKEGLLIDKVSYSNNNEISIRSKNIYNSKLDSNKRFLIRKVNAEFLVIRRTLFNRRSTLDLIRSNQCEELAILPKESILVLLNINNFLEISDDFLESKNMVYSKFDSIKVEFCK